MYALLAGCQVPPVGVPADVDGDVGAETRSEPNELLEREAVEASVPEVGHARLVGSKELGGVHLGPAVEAIDDGPGNGFFQRRDGVGWSHV